MFSDKPSKMLNYIRVVFIGVIVFEFLNWLQILPFKAGYTWLGLIITSGGTYGILEYANYRLKKYYHIGLPWLAFMIALVPIIFDMLGDMMSYYNYWWYDVIAHFVGSAVVTAIMLIIFFVLSRGNYINWFLETKLFFALTISVFFGVLYELEEYGEDLLTCYHQSLIPDFISKLMPCGYRFGDAFDTGTDLLCDTLGGLIVVLLVWIIIKKRNLIKINY